MISDAITKDAKVSLPSTVGKLKSSGLQTRSIREEIRRNLADAMRSGRPLFPGIVGYETTVIPAVVNALLAGQDILLLGERGQAKTRLARSLTELLDEWVPVLDGTDIPDDPTAPVTKAGRRIGDTLGDGAPVRWLHRSERFAEKLATPDTSIADLIGEIDPIKITEGRYLTDEEAISPGLIPASNKCIFNLNELPDLSERIQVGLLNILEEQDVQIRGFRMRLPVDLLVVASANPEDYTNRGRIITPLKDRFGSQIRTHYPTTVELEVQIADQERHAVCIDGVRSEFPDFMKRIIATTSALARASEDISSRSGVSVRATIANFELVEAAAVRRALLTSADAASPRPSDLGACIEPMIGKLEFDHFGTRSESQLVRELFGAAMHRVFTTEVSQGERDPVERAIASGLEVSVSPETSSAELVDRMHAVAGIQVPDRFSESDATVAAWFEFVLEGLAQDGVIARSHAGDALRYVSSGA